ncbi:DUF1080 domain-containing protein [Planctomycetota bacterium]
MIAFLKKYSARLFRCRLYILFLLIFNLIPSGCNSLQRGESTFDGSMFDGKNLGNWKVYDFYKHGNVYIQDGNLILEKGLYLTGVKWDGPLIRMNYEISLEAMRIDGQDFFCGLTFPVDANNCSLILSGWGGGYSGLSSINGFDASENETTRSDAFENNRWYKVVVRVTPGRIQAWVDSELFVDVFTTGKRISIRPDIEMSLPLGISTYSTTGAVRNIYLRKLEE